MVGNIFKASSRIALVSLASLVGCLDVDDAPELDETADPVASGAVEASANATSEVSADVATVLGQTCTQFGFGRVCVRVNDAYNVIGIFDNNSAGPNTVKITIRRYDPDGNDIVKECDWHLVEYGDSRRCVYYNPVYGAFHRACVRLRDGRIGCSDWLDVL